MYLYEVFQKRNLNRIKTAIETYHCDLFCFYRTPNIFYIVCMYLLINIHQFQKKTIFLPTNHYSCIVTTASYTKVFYLRKKTFDLSLAHKHLYRRELPTNAV